MASAQSKVQYSRRVRMFREGYLSVCIFKNVMESGDTHYDTVVYRKIGRGTSAKWRRGTALKPTDLGILAQLLSAANDFFKSEGVLPT